MKKSLKPFILIVTLITVNIPAQEFPTKFEEKDKFGLKDQNNFLPFIIGYLLIF